MTTKAERRENKRRKKKRMKVSGGSVKQIQRIKVDQVENPEKYWSR